ncbi:MAG: TetR/AcrR family transcriptional regulator [Pseudomonadota bacterium]
MNYQSKVEDSEFTDRQAQVLEAGLALLVAGGEKAITTAGLARAANCSKESLYKWFGDREGVLSAMIAYQASKVRVPAAAASANRSAEDFRVDFEAFGNDLLTVLSGSTSIALNRLAVGQASADGAPLGDLLVNRGRSAIRARAKALLEAARRAGHLRFDDTEEAFETLYGLLVRDKHVRMLLGEKLTSLGLPLDQNKQVKRALDQFYRLYGAEFATL